MKARIEKDHEVLEIGSGWGSLAIEVVKRTGCKYTGITLSKEQLKYAQIRVQEAGLQVHRTSITSLDFFIGVKPILNLIKSDL